MYLPGNWADDAYNYPSHPLAEHFPLLAGQEFRDLCDSIRDHGQHHPIILLDGMVLDGRNRLLACRQIGALPWVQEFDGAAALAAGGDKCSPLDYVEDANLRRRDLTPHQRAAIIVALEAERGKIAAEAEQRKIAGRERGLQVIAGNRGALEMDSSPTSEMPQGGAPKPRLKTRTALAKKARVSEHQIQQAEKVRKAAPNVLAEVAKGERTLPDAVKEVSRFAARNYPPMRKRIGHILGTLDAIVMVISPEYLEDRADKKFAPFDVELIREAFPADQLKHHARQLREYAEAIAAFANNLENPKP